MCGYVHIMLTGQTTNHAERAAVDPSFKPIDEIYLIHSPDEEKATGPKKKPTLFKKIASDCKKVIETIPALNLKGKVHLVSIRSAFELEPTMERIIEIYYKEIETHTKDKIVVNVTGGTNMMVVGAMIAAGSKHTNAYYVLDDRFHKNLQSYLRPIGIPNWPQLAELQENEQKVLYEISQSTFEWPHTPKNETKRRKPYDIGDPDKPDEVSKGYSMKDMEVRYFVNDDIAGSEWMAPRTIKGAITLSSGKSGKLAKNIGLNEIMKDKHITRTKKPFDPKTVNRVIRRLIEKAFVTESRNVPYLTAERKKGDNRRREYRISKKEVMYTITELGKLELRGSM